MRNYQNFKRAFTGSEKNFRETWYRWGCIKFNKPIDPSSLSEDEREDLIENSLDFISEKLGMCFSAIIPAPGGYFQSASDYRVTKYRIVFWQRCGFDI